MRQSYGNGRSMQGYVHFVLYPQNRMHIALHTSGLTEGTCSGTAFLAEGIFTCFFSRPVFFLFVSLPQVSSTVPHLFKYTRLPNNVLFFLRLTGSGTMFMLSYLVYTIEERVFQYSTSLRIDRCEDELLRHCPLLS